MMIGDTVVTFAPKRKNNALTTHSNSSNVTQREKNHSRHR